MQQCIRYMGKGVSKAVESINKVIGPAVKVSLPKLRSACSKCTEISLGNATVAIQGTHTSMLQGMNPINQKEVDQKMFDLDGTENKGKLGANAILAVSMAVCKVGVWQHQHCKLSHTRPALQFSSSFLFPIAYCAKHALIDHGAYMQAGAAEKEIPIYKHIAELAGNTKLVSRRRFEGCLMLCSDACTMAATGAPQCTKYGKVSLPYCACSNPSYCPCVLTPAPLRHCAQTSAVQAFCCTAGLCTPLTSLWSAGAASAQLQHHQRRQPCWQRPRHAGVHDPPHRRLLLHRGHADGLRGACLH